MKEVIIEPSVALLDSMRSVGYSLEAAVADLIDNSIDASARHIQIDVDVVEGRHVAVIDDGHGMTDAQAQEALRLAGVVNDDGARRLGRFGLGLKTASLSQARSLTVISQKDGAAVAYRWDIDHVRKSGSWNLLALEASEWSDLPFAPHLLELDSGTLIVWEKLDLLLGDTEEPGAFLAATIEPLAQHLGLTYHRYLERGHSVFQVVLNGRSVQAVDPFLRSNPKTQFTPTETIQVGENTVSFAAYTLPHQSGLSKSEKDRADLGEGMRESQGFYIYRNKRLISRGHWFGLAKMGELTKLTRIQVDIPRELDSLWQLDIKKSRTEPPASFKSYLKKMMDPILTRGKRVHAFRGRKESSGPTVHVWDKVKDRSGFRYEINLENPLVQAALLRLDSSQAETILGLFETISAQYPVLDVYNEMAGNVAPIQKVVDSRSVLQRLELLKRSEVLQGTADEVHSVLKHAEPFDSINDLKELIERVWSANE